MNDSNRRDFIQAAGLSLLATTLSASAQADTTETAKGPAFDSTQAPASLPFDPKSLKGLSEKLIQSHWENNYTGAVKALNVVRSRLGQAGADANTPAYVYNGLKREQLVRTGSVVLHEAYFGNLGGDGKAGADLRSRIAQSFGTLDAWETEFRKIGQGLSGGSGWVVLGLNRHLNILENYWMADHATGPIDTTPYWSWICTSTPIRWTTPLLPPSTSMPSSSISSGTGWLRDSTGNLLPAEPDESKQPMLGRSPPDRGC